MSGSPTGSRTDPVSLGLVVVVTILIATAVGVRLWANQQRLEVPNFKAMTATDDGRVFVVVGERLFIESADGSSTAVLPLASWGISDFQGNLAVLSDDSIVLGQGLLGPVGVREGLRMFSRQRPSPDDPVERLQRCRSPDPSAPADACVPMDGSGEPLALHRGFMLDVDEERGLLYATDPATHRIIQATLDGQILDVSTGDWVFPNGIRVLDDGGIAFADTNNARYVELAAGRPGIGGIRTQENILDWIEEGSPHRFPFDLHVDRNGVLWLLVADEDMDDALLYRRARDGGAYRLPLPATADPVAVTGTREQILVADARRFVIHSFDHHGVAQDAFGSGTLKGELAELRQRHDRYKLLFASSLWAVLAVALPALAFGLYHQQRKIREDMAPHSEALSPVPSRPIPDVESWADPQSHVARLGGEYVFVWKNSILGTREIRRMKWLAGAVILVSLVSLVLLTPSLPDEDASEMLALLSDPTILLTLLVSLLAAVAEGVIRTRTRLVLDDRGIRYIPPFAGVPAFLGDWTRPWSYTWQELASLELVHRGEGAQPLAWYYELKSADGAVRRVKPLNWQLAGMEEVGMPLALSRKPAADTIRAAIRQTLLYALLAERADAKATV